MNSIITLYKTQMFLTNPVGSDANYRQFKSGNIRGNIRGNIPQVLLVGNIPGNFTGVISSNTFQVIIPKYYR